MKAAQKTKSGADELHFSFPLRFNVPLRASTIASEFFPRTVGCTLDTAKDRATMNAISKTKIEIGEIGCDNLKNMLATGLRQVIEIEEKLITPFAHNYLVSMTKSVRDPHDGSANNELVGCMCVMKYKNPRLPFDSAVAQCARCGLTAAPLHPFTGEVLPGT